MGGVEIVETGHFVQHEDDTGLWHYSLFVTLDDEYILDIRLRTTSSVIVSQISSTTGQAHLSAFWTMQLDDFMVAEIFVSSAGVGVLSAAHLTNFTATRLAALPALVSGTVDAQVAGGPDDAHETDAGTSFAHTAVTLRVEPNASAGSRWNAGMRFVIPDIPQGATIAAAWLEVVFPASQRDSPRLTLYGELVVDAPDFATVQDVTSRSRTNASVPWSDDGLGSGSFVQSPDISSVVQDIVDQAGWLPDNALVILAIADNAGPEAVRFTPYDNIPANACKLHIEWST
jgi:hypothetical protein